MNKLTNEKLKNWPNWGNKEKNNQREKCKKKEWMNKMIIK